MRVERINNNRVKVFMSYEDLTERGLARDDLWAGSPDLQDLINEMMDEVYDVLGFEVYGAVAIELYALPSHGVIVVITRNDDGVFEFPTLTSQQGAMRINKIITLTCEFDDFENVIQAAEKLNQYKIDSSLFYFSNNYYLFFKEEVIKSLSTKEHDNLAAILSEYGKITSYTFEYLREYGKTIFPSDAINCILKFFEK